jgi:O-antigen/teichoic acid export membrane protein
MPLRRDKRTKLLSIYSMIAAILNIGLNFIFIPRWGAYGATISTIIAQLLVVVIYNIYLRRSFSIFVEYRRLFTLVALTILMYIPLLYLNEIDLFLRIPMKIFIISAFPFLLYLLRFYSKEELNRIKGGWKKWSKLSDIKKNISKIKR